MSKGCSQGDGKAKSGTKSASTATPANSAIVADAGAALFAGSLASESQVPSPKWTMKSQAHQVTPARTVKLASVTLGGETILENVELQPSEKISVEYLFELEVMHGPCRACLSKPDLLPLMRVSTSAFGLVNRVFSWEKVSLLHVAVRTGKIHVAKLLLKDCRAEDVNTRIGGVEDGRFPLNDALYRDNIEMVELLLEHRADVNAKYGNQSPLHAAVSRHNSKMAQLLLEHGANVHSGGPYGQSCLHVAVLWKNIDMVWLLLECGADVHAGSGGDLNQSPLEAAGNDTEIGQLLIQYATGWEEARTKRTTKTSSTGGQEMQRQSESPGLEKDSTSKKRRERAAFRRSTRTE